MTARLQACFVISSENLVLILIWIFLIVFFFLLVCDILEHFLNVANGNSTSSNSLFGSAAGIYVTAAVR